MVAETFERGLRSLARRAPFHPFTVELVSGERIEVDYPEALVYRAGMAVFVNAEGLPTLFDHESVSRLIAASDANATTQGA